MNSAPDNKDRNQSQNADQREGGIQQPMDTSRTGEQEQTIQRNPTASPGAGQMGGGINGNGGAMGMDEQVQRGNDASMADMDMAGGARQGQVGEGRTGQQLREPGEGDISSLQDTDQNRDERDALGGETGNQAQHSGSRLENDGQLGSNTGSEMDSDTSTGRASSGMTGGSVGAGSGAGGNENTRSGSTRHGLSPEPGESNR